MENKNFNECDIFLYNQLPNKEYITTYIKEKVKIDDDTNVAYIERIPYVVYRD